MSEEVIIKQGETPAEKPAEAKPYAGPDYIPEKFRAAEDPAKAMAEAYAELEKKQSAPKPEEKPATEEKPAEGAKPNEEKPAAENTAAFDPFYAEYEKEGKLSDASYEALNKLGVSRELADSFIAGQQAIASAAGAALMGAVGGEESYRSMLAWGANGGLTQAEQDAYDNVLASGNSEATKTMAQAIFAKFKAATGEDPGRTIEGNGNSAGSAGRYQSYDQMLADMAKPEYRNDSAFREQVAQRAARSNW